MEIKKMKIWAMTEGPYHYTDLPPEDIEEYPHIGELEWFAVCKVEVDGKLIDHEFRGSMATFSLISLAKD